uniref:Fibrinogen like 2 n=1 Tax=Poecilia latipinna TaxID=48699 RepID=A0A3B3TUS1_9TELE
MEQEITNSPDLTSGQKDIGEQPHTSPDNTNNSTQNHFKPSQEFETETATPLTEAVDISEENSLQEPKYNPDLTPGQTYVPDQATVAPDQKKNSSQDRLKIKRKPESTQGSSSEYNKIETSTKPPKQTLLTEPLKKSNKNPSHDPKSNPDVRPGWTSAPDQPAITHHLKNKSSQGIPETKHKRKPKPSKPKSQRSETTASPKPNQKFLTHVGDKSEENLTRKSKNPSDLTPRLEVISDRANTTLDYMDKSSQESHKTKYKPENNREYKFEKANNSDENSLQEFISHPHLTPGQTSALDQATKHSDQITKSGEDHLEKTHKSENIQGFKSNKSETANTRPSTKSVGMSEENSWQEPTPNPGLRPHRGTTSPDQIKKSIEDHLKSENIHKIKFNKSGTATSKPIQELFPEDCSDHLLRGKTRSGLYLVTPDLRSSSFQVFCDMELDGGGWTLLQRRQDGSVSFNRPWVEYQAGFGVLDGGEFWLGNNKMHLLTRDRDMELRVELEDFDGVTEHAQYEHFRVASERLRYRLTVGGYSGTAGDALRFSKTYDHNNRAFTTPDRDNDRYPSGNCGAYYSSGWWFDACMAANLNGKYYFGKYKGVRDGIFWGTWHNISTEYYPTNERQSFKSVRMMTRPKSFGLR